MSATAPSSPPDDLSRLPPRDADGHKGTFGTVAVLAGCAGPKTVMLGAPALVARAAFRAGAGLVKLLAPAPVLPHALTLEPSATGLPLPVHADASIQEQPALEAIDRAVAGSSVLAVGPGLGESVCIERLVLRALQQEDVPVVLDADGLNALARIPDPARDFRAAAVLTPHPGEYRRLAQAVNLTLDPTDPQQRPQACESLAQRLGCVVLLKGARTVVSDGQRTRINESGHACLATAGSGDVLTGLLAGLIAGYFKPSFGCVPEPDLYELTRVAAYVHGLAGERWARDHSGAGLRAMELADLLPEALDAVRASG